MFYHIVERKTVFLGYKNKKFKKSKNWDFSKGVNPCFWSKNGRFSIFFFFGNISQEHVFKDILERKTVFLGNKNKKFKKSKNWDFSKEVNPCVWSKNGHFSNFFFFRKYRPGKCVLWYCRTKTRLSRLKKQEVQKLEKLRFFLRS